MTTTPSDAAERVRETPLVPCKYCRSVDEVRIKSIELAGGPGCVVVCMGCGTQSDRAFKRAAAVKSWNYLHLRKGLFP